MGNSVGCKSLAGQSLLVDGLIDIVPPLLVVFGLLLAVVAVVALVPEVEFLL